ncbi:hypothetical protein GCM10020258_52160 [Sphingomonas yabuuchiae]
MELAQIERAGAGYVPGCGNGIGIEAEAPLHFAAGFEVSIGISLTLETQGIDGRSMTDRRDDVLQELPLDAVIEDIAKGDTPDTEIPPLCVQFIYSQRIIRPPP